MDPIILFSQTDSLTYKLHEVKKGETSYGIAKKYPTPEKAEINPQYPYALTKRLGEELVIHWHKVYKLKAISLRFFNLYGTKSRTDGTYGAMFGVFFLTIKGLFVPRFIWENLDILFYSILAAVISIAVIRNYARKLQENEGKQLPVFSISIGLFVILPIIAFLIGGVSLSFEVPVLKQIATTSFIYEGGLGLPPELIALTLALALYTATFIAECVRAGIQGISKGQKEAAASIGLTPNQVLKLVIMPQALRIIIPPTTNQYLNLTKNSSLAAAIAYPDLVLVFAGTALMQTGRAIEIVSITMLTYLSISLTISLFMNWYNKIIAIKEK